MCVHSFIHSLDVFSQFAKPAKKQRVENSPPQVVGWLLTGQMANDQVVGHIGRRMAADFGFDCVFWKEAAVAYLVLHF